MIVGPAGRSRSRRNNCDSWSEALDRRRQHRQVGTIATVANRAFRLDIEGSAHVFQHLRRSGRGQRQQTLGTALAGELNQLEIVGPEVVSPFRNAMRLVDRE